MKKLIVAIAASMLMFAPVAVLADTVPGPTGTVVHGGEILSNVVAYGATAFGTAIAALIVAIVYKVMGWLGIQVTQAQKDQLQGIVVNGLNAAAAKAQTQLKANANLDVNVKNQIVADTVAYAQTHAADTIKALGLDPQSGQAVEAIKARIETAIADPNTPTAPAITPVTAGGAVPVTTKV